MDKRTITTFIGVFLIFLLGFVIGKSGNKIPVLKNGTEAVVTMTGNNITANQLYDEMKNRFARDTLVYLIDDLILNDKFKTDDDLDAQIKGQINMIKEQTGEDFLPAIKNQWGINNEEELYDFIGVSLKRNLAIDDYIETLITEKEIEKYYEDKIDGDIKASHILIKPDVTDDMEPSEKEEKEKEALKKAKDLIKQLNEGADFAKLAKKHSADTGNAENGGELDWFNKGKMDEAFEKAAYKLKKNKYTKEPVKSQFGYHIILKTDEKEKPKLKKVKAEIIDNLITEKLNANLELSYEAIEELRKEYELKIHDSNLKKQYNDYMKALKEQINQQ